MRVGGLRAAGRNSNAGPVPSPYSSVRDPWVRCAGWDRLGGSTGRAGGCGCSPRGSWPLRSGLRPRPSWWSGATLRLDSVALARVEVQPLGGSLVSATGVRAGGAQIPLRSTAAASTPRALLAPGEPVTVDVVVRRPRWLRLGARLEPHRAPDGAGAAAALMERWLTVAGLARCELRFAEPVDRVSYTGQDRPRRRPAGRSRSGPRRRRERVEVASAVAPVGAPRPTRVRVTWFPPSRLPVVLVSPAAVSRSPRRPDPADVLAAARQGARRRAAAVCLERPGQLERARQPHARLHAERVRLPARTATCASSCRPARRRRGLERLRTVDWTVAGAGFLRLQQLLAQAGYLPVGWHPAGAPVAQHRRAPRSTRRSSRRPARFAWRYPNTPPELQRALAAGRSRTRSRAAR